MLFISCESQLGETSVTSLSGKNYNQSLPRVTLYNDINEQILNGQIDFSKDLIVVDDGVFFVQNHPLFGNELFYFDYNANVSYLVDDLNFGAAGSDPEHFKRIGNYVYFFAETDHEGYELRRVNVNNPTYIESFDVVSGLSSTPGINSAVTNNETEYIEFEIYQNYLYIVYTNTTTQNYIELINLNNYKYTELLSANTLNYIYPSSIKRVGNRMYLKAKQNFAANDVDIFYINMNSSFSNINIVNDSSMTTAFENKSFKVLGNYAIYEAEDDNNNPQIYLHDGTTNYLLDFLSLYSNPAATIFSISAPKVLVAGDYLYVVADDGKLYKVDVSNPAAPTAYDVQMDNSGNFSPGIFAVGDNVCSYTYHYTGSTRDLSCYVEHLDMTYLLKTNNNNDQSLNVIPSSVGVATLATYTNNGSMIGAAYGFATHDNQSTLFLTTKGTSGNMNLYEIELSGSIPTITERDTNVPVIMGKGKVTDDFTLIVDATGSNPGDGIFYDRNTDVASSTVSMPFSTGTLLSGASSNAEILFENEKYMVVLLEEQAFGFGSTPDNEGEIAIINKQNGNVDRTGSPGLRVPYIAEKPFRMKVGNYFYIETEVGGGAGLFRVNLSNGSYVEINTDDNGDPVDFLQRYIDIIDLNGVHFVHAEDDSNNFDNFYINSNNRFVDITGAQVANATSKNVLRNNNELFIVQNIGGTEGVYKFTESSGVISMSLLRENTSMDLIDSIYYNSEAKDGFIYINEIGNNIAHIAMDNSVAYGGFSGTNGSAMINVGTSSNLAFRKVANKLFVQEVPFSLGSEVGTIDINSGTGNPEYNALSMSVQATKLNDDIPYFFSDDDSYIINKEGEVELFVSDHLDNDDCNNLGTGGVNYKDIFLKEGVLRYFNNATTDLCIISKYGDVTNFITYGFSGTSTFHFDVIADLGDRVIMTLTNESNGNTNLLEVDLFKESITVLTSGTLVEAPNSVGYKLKDEVIYCDENFLYSYDIYAQNIEVIDDRYICDPRLMSRSYDGNAVYFSGADRDDYIGFELYQVNPR
jgi:ELWxxDGT repeat protein